MTAKRYGICSALLACFIFAGVAWAAVKTGSAAPDFTAKDLNGRTVRLSQFSGKPVVLYFWASW